MEECERVLEKDLHDGRAVFSQVDLVKLELSQLYRRFLPFPFYSFLIQAHSPYPPPILTIISKLHLLAVFKCPPSLLSLL